MRINNTQRSTWLLCLGVVVLASVLTYWPDGLLQFRYDRAALSSGQWWRLVTGHLVHLNTQHLLLNVLGLLLVIELLWDDFSFWHGLSLLGFASIGISALMWLFHPELIWYAGLSGVLHALWAGCALAGAWPWKARKLARVDTVSAGHVSWKRYVYLIAILLLIVKLAFEWRYGASVRTEQMIGAPVVTIAHLYGAFLGLIYVLLCRIAIMLHMGNDA